MPVLNLTFAKKKANGNGENQGFEIYFSPFSSTIALFQHYFYIFGFLCIIKNRLSYANIIFLDFCTGFHGDKLS